MTQCRQDKFADANPDATGAYRIGGGLMPPKKIKDVAPEYPPLHKEARVQGVVIMEVRVDEHGNVSDVRVLRSIPLLDQAAIDAVKQWQYTAHDDEWRRRARHHDGDGEFHAARFHTATACRLQMLLPDGRTFMDGEVRSDVPIRIDVPGVGRAHFKASRSRGTI